jgi:hypothetical protein
VNQDLSLLLAALLAFVIFSLLHSQPSASDTALAVCHGFHRYSNCLAYANTVESLQALCLIPRSPTPVALEDRPEDSLNREELLELLRRQKAKAPLEIKPEFKREYVEDYDEDDDDGDLMVLHAPTKKLKASLDADTGVETIDLTDD